MIRVVAKEATGSAIVLMEKLSTKSKLNGFHEHLIKQKTGIDFKKNLPLKKQKIAEERAFIDKLKTPLDM